MRDENYMNFFAFSSWFLCKLYYSNLPQKKWWFVFSYINHFSMQDALWRHMHKNKHAGIHIQIPTHTHTQKIPKHTKSEYTMCVAKCYCKEQSYAIWPFPQWTSNTRAYKHTSTQHGRTQFEIGSFFAYNVCGIVLFVKELRNRAVSAMGA